MEDSFKRIHPKDINENFIELIGYDWMLITAGEIESFNTMTAAWGGTGFLWNKAVAFIFVRPQRYTYEFTEKYENFTLCFFDETYRDILKFCGTHSGRDVDKVKECELTPCKTRGSGIYFKESRLVLECKKLYYDDINPENFIDKGLEKIYAMKDYHRIYIGEVVDCFIKKEELK